MNCTGRGQGSVERLMCRFSFVWQILKWIQFCSQRDNNWKPAGGASCSVLHTNSISCLGSWVTEKDSVASSQTVPCPRPSSGESSLLGPQHTGELVWARRVGSVLPWLHVVAGYYYCADCFLFLRIFKGDILLFFQFFHFPLVCYRFVVYVKGLKVKKAPELPTRAGSGWPITTEWSQQANQSRLGFIEREGP